MRERWELLLMKSTGTFTEAYLSELFPHTASGDTVYVNGAVFADADLAAAVMQLEIGHTLKKAGIVIAAHIPAFGEDIASFNDFTESLPSITYEADMMSLANVWDIFSLNRDAIAADFDIVTRGRKSAAVPAGVTVSGNQLFIEEGANIYAGCVINAATGPVYIGREAEVLEGTLIRGPLAVCDHAVIKMGAKIYGATTIGPGSKVGGEINNAVFFANSNKSHDGYLGNSVIGEWCNLGADTNCSNLKNNYDVVKIRHEASGEDISTGATFTEVVSPTSISTPSHGVAAKAL
jgi:UDP-N-acetylglucosamine diphosphorylase/glucosamine-1-phosphate N-acetyltransferase